MERRRLVVSWFVEPYRQIKLGLIFIVLNLSFAALFSGVVGYYFLDVYETVSRYFQLSADQGAQVLEKFQVPILFSFILVVVFVVLSLLASVHYTYQIYGPLVSIHRYLDELLENRSTKPLELRSSDQLQELAAKISQLGHSMDQVNSGVDQNQLHLYLDAIISGNALPKGGLETDHEELVEKLRIIYEMSGGNGIAQ